MNKTEQRAAAKELFFLGWDQNRIAATVDVTPATLSKWVTVDGWREERAKKYSIHDSISNSLLELIDYQLSAIKEKVKGYKDEGSMKLLDKGEIDALSKLFAGVKQKDISWTHYVNVCRELANHVATKDPDFAKALIEFTDVFLMQKRESLI
jgi:predicted transcriptional regulator